MVRVKKLNIKKIESIHYNLPLRSNSKITITYFDKDSYTVDEIYERKEIEDIIFTHASGYILVYHPQKKDTTEKFMIYKLKGYNMFDEPMAFGLYGLVLRKREGIVFSSMTEMPILIEIYKQNDNYDICLNISNIPKYITGESWELIQNKSNSSKS